MSELRKEIQQATKRKVTPYIWEYLEGDVIDSILDAVIASLPKYRPNVVTDSGIGYTERQVGKLDAIEEVKSILLEAKEK